MSTKYSCQRCLKEFSQKSHYQKHLDRKNPCQDTQGKIEQVVKRLINDRQPTKRPNFIEVCAGCGGLSKGFIDSGFHPLLLNDNDKVCLETLKLNHPNANIFKGSMLEIDLKKYQKMDLDLLMGGVPCQSFSQAGKREGIKDDRGKLILHFIKMIDQIKPRMFLIENVPGLATHKKGETLNYIIGKINKMNRYHVCHKVLNANDYSVAQNRKRLIIVGIRKDIKKKFNFPRSHEYKPVLRDVLTNCPESKGVKYKEDKYNLMKLVPEGGCWVDLPVSLQKSYMGKSFDSDGGKRGILKRLDMDKPSLTLLTSPSQKQTERCHPTETRPLQTLEYARIQSFPDDYQFAGSVNQIYKQIGNAVPVNLAKAIAEEVAKTLK